MKTIRSIFFLLFALMTFTGFGQSDAISKFFDKYVDDEQFTVVYISPKMMEMVVDLSEEEGDAAEVDEVLSGIKGIRILTTEQNTLQYYKEALSVLELNQYEVLMQVRDGDENVRFLVKDEGPRVKELLLLVGGEDDFVLISFVGDIDLKKISKLGDKMDIEGLEHLEELEEK
jgi:hypothetical protein